MTGKEQRKAPILRFKGFTDDWEQRKLGELTSRVKSYSISHNAETPEITGTKYIHYGDIHTGKLSRIEDDKILPNIKDHNFQPLKNGDIVVADASEDYKGIADACLIDLKKQHYKIVSGLHTIAFRPNEFLKSYFLYIYFHTSWFKHYGYRYGTGLKVFGITYNNLRNMKFKLPSSNEQQKIDKLIKLVNQNITLQQRKLERSNRLYQGLIKKLFKNQDSWQEIQLAKLVTVLDKKRIPVKRQDRLPGSIPYYGANGIQDHVNNYTHEGSFVLIAEDGANSLTDYPVFHVCGKIWVNNHTHVLKVNPSVNSVFLTIALKRLNFSKYIVGGSRSKLNLKDLKQISLKLPKKQEQDKIGKIYKEIHNLQALEKSTISNLKFVKQFLLQNMFI